jgi:hypothetical protein
LEAALRGKNRHAKKIMEAVAAADLCGLRGEHVAHAGGVLEEMAVQTALSAAIVSKDVAQLEEAISRAQFVGASRVKITRAQDILSEIRRKEAVEKQNKINLDLIINLESPRSLASSYNSTASTTDSLQSPNNFYQGGLQLVLCKQQQQQQGRRGSCPTLVGSCASGVAEVPIKQAWQDLQRRSVSTPSQGARLGSSQPGTGKHRPRSRAMENRSGNPVRRAKTASTANLFGL